jgi:type VI secretion system protein ImpF
MVLERMVDLEPSERSMLLQRLVEFESSERSGTLEQLDRADANFLRGADLRESVVRAIRRLLDTRRHVPLAEAAKGGDLTVLDYGIPDFGNRSPADSEARLLFGLAIKHAIKAFEPRLKDADVEVVAPVIGGRDLEVIITGSISDGRIAEQVTFRRTSAGKVINGEPDPVE